MKKIFPKSFFWGSGTSAIQVEGGNVWSDWAYYEKIKPFIKSGEKIGRCADHYNRYKEDLDLAKSLNQNAHRFTIEWSRIEKDPGVFDKKEIAHYRDVIKKIRELNMEPFPTLHHFSNPTWFAVAGGWEKKESPELFARFVVFIVKELGENINYWFTINEPNTYLGLGYLTATFPPLKRNLIAGYRALNNLAKAHNKAYEVIKSKYPKSQVGAITNIQLLTTINGKTSGIIPKIVNYVSNYYFPDKTKKHADFFGLNYYFPTRAKKVTKERTDMGWEIYPKGLYDSVLETWNRYKLPIYIAENGIADSKDSKRENYISDHLSYLHDAIKKGVDVRGYFYWTLLDNLELAEGYWPKFGLIEVNFDTMKRSIKKSALSYADICKNNYLEVN